MPTCGSLESNSKIAPCTPSRIATVHLVDEEKCEFICEEIEQIRKKKTYRKPYPLGHIRPGLYSVVFDGRNNSVVGAISVSASAKEKSAEEWDNGGVLVVGEGR